MFCIGEYVIYRSEGICVITDIRCENFGTIGKNEKYYILSPLKDKKSTVFVPVENEALVGMMRKILSASEIEAMVEELRKERLEWITDSRARNTKFKEILALGDRRELVILANTVIEKINSTIGAGKRPCNTDLNALKRAEALLFEEFSATVVLNSPEEIEKILSGDQKPQAKQ